MLDLKPWEFFSMTLREFNAKIEGYAWAKESESRRMAWAMANVINACGQLRKGSRLTVDKLSPKRNLSPRNPYYRKIVG